MRLAETPVLLLDIQASAAASAGGALLEVGWQPHPAPAPDGAQFTDNVQTYLAQMPVAEIAPRLGRLTGLSTEQMQSAHPPHEIWRNLQFAARTVATANALAANDGSVCPVVAHYARFEAPYLQQMQMQTHPQQSKDQGPQNLHLDLICTHEIARRLLPGLPRKGLRAVAGYFGYDTSALRRCRHHLAATSVIWTALAEQLSSLHGVNTLTELKAWIMAIPVPRPGGRQFQVPGEMLRQLPEGPGIYRFLSRTGKPLYVGKAKDLSQRVRTYFQPRRKHPEHILEMLSRAVAVKTTPTPSALEAALLEQDVIKQLAPPYNIALAPAGTPLQFWSRDLTSRSPQADAHHPRGPVPAAGPFTLLEALVNALAAGGDAATRLRPLLDQGGKEPLDSACLGAGLELFRQAHQETLHRMPPGHALLAVARQLWIDQQIGAEEETDTASAEKSATSAPLWTPERVRRHLEHAVRQAGALLRRSRWLIRLGNATLIWRLPDTHTEVYRALTFHQGVVIARRNRSSLAAPPQETAPSLSPRWRPQDRTTYDRLRVATTELRRLVHEKRPVTIVLKGKNNPALNREHLARLLHWL